jgi:hypothetical protein
MALKRFVVEMDDYMATVLTNSGRIRIVENMNETDEEVMCVPRIEKNDGSYEIDLYFPEQKEMGGRIGC